MYRFYKFKTICKRLITLNRVALEGRTFDHEEITIQLAQRGIRENGLNSAWELTFPTFHETPTFNYV